MLIKKKTSLTAIFVLVWAACARSAHAQTIDGFTVGDDLRVVAKAYPRPDTGGPVGAYLAFKWVLPASNSVSVTASPQTGRIVFIEADWGGKVPFAITGLPGVTLGTSSLRDVRRKFGSNGFGFASNAVTIGGSNLIAINCYQIVDHPNLVLALVTLLPTAGLAGTVPDSGKGTLHAVILGDLSYLEAIWGTNRLFDTSYHPVEWK